jgi:hypothetical protein
LLNFFNPSSNKLYSNLKKKKKKKKKKIDSLNQEL